MTESVDAVSRELRNVEQEVDEAYRRNFLVKENFPQAAWHLLSIVEDLAAFPILQQVQRSNHELIVEMDGLIESVSIAMIWLFKSCPTRGQIKNEHTERTAQYVTDLLRLATDYRSFVAAFTYATRGLVKLYLEGRGIRAEHKFLTDIRYEAYNRLVKPTKVWSKLDLPSTIEIPISVQVRGDRFQYSFTPRTVHSIYTWLQPVITDAFELPGNWRITHYSLGQFADFALALTAMAFAHFKARVVAAQGGCTGAGYRDSVMIFEHDSLVARIARYAELDHIVIQRIIEDLTYGNRGILKPDLALQPLVPITRNRYLLAPHFFISLSLERNLTALLNRLPTERNSYSRLVGEKERVMQARIKSKLANLGYRFLNATMPIESGLPDIDLAILSDDKKVGLILELKWFIDPSDIGEVVARSEDLQKGIDQVKRVKREMSNQSSQFFESLQIDTSYELRHAVVSANWIGFEDVQDPAVPIVNEKHLIEQITAVADLRQIFGWLDNRDYLPIEGHDFQTEALDIQIQDWTLKWYGLQPLNPR